MKTQRVDILLVEQGHCETREQAKRLLLAGEVKSGDRVIDKPSTKLPLDVALELKAKPRFVGRGGLKLERALEAFGISPENLVCADLGASTGGFTDCLLQNGAARVHAIDVGTNQLVWKIRNDPRVMVKEKFNARGLEVDHLGEKVSLVVIDVSFISLTKILPAAFRILGEGGSIVCLIKPQFELRREDIGKGGIVRDPDLHQRAINKIREFVESGGWQWRDLIDSPITGMDGNREFLAWLS